MDGSFPMHDQQYSKPVVDQAAKHLYDNFEATRRPPYHPHTEVIIQFSLLHIFSFGSSCSYFPDIDANFICSLEPSAKNPRFSRLLSKRLSTLSCNGLL